MACPDDCCSHCKAIGVNTQQAIYYSGTIFAGKQVGDERDMRRGRGQRMGLHVWLRSIRVQQDRTAQDYT